MTDVKISELSVGTFRSLGDSAIELQRNGSPKTSSKIPPGLIASKARTFALSRSVAAPPGSPAEFDRYIVPTGGTGAWVGMDHLSAEWLKDGNGNGAWYFADVNGLVFVDDEDAVFTAVGGVLTAFGGNASSSALRTVTASAGSKTIIGSDRFIKADDTLGGFTLTMNPNLGTSAATIVVRVTKIGATAPIQISDGTNIVAALIGAYAPPGMASFVDIMPDGANLICSGNP